MGKIVFITGGARSGKSSFALAMAEELGGRMAYLATAQALDDEMHDRIEKHKEERGPGWETFEEPTEVPSLLDKLRHDHDVVLVDCLTMWVTNLMEAGEDVEEASEALLEALEAKHDAPVIFVTNEVGLGIVPDNELSRRFRDLAGMVNRKTASVADEAYIVTAGMPLKLK